MTRLFVLMVALGGATGCAATIALDRAVLAYDVTTADSVSKQLLLNIARARHNEPMHFTAISNIAATYRVSISAGAGPALTGDAGGLLVPVLGVAVEESPTISIAPMQGEEFTQRLLTPFHEDRFTLLLRQGYDVDALVRLMGAEVRLGSGPEATLTVHNNRPSDAEGYPVFRRVVAHISAIQDQHALYVEPLHFTHTWTVPADSVTPESFESTYKGFSLSFDDAQQVYRVSRRINGRVMISNYDPSRLSNADRVRLHEEADQVPRGTDLCCARHGGGARVRCAAGPAHTVDQGKPRAHAGDPRGGKPAQEVRLAVGFRGRHYAVRPQAAYQWNQKVFSLLYQLFQMSMTTVAPGGPTLAIVK